MPLLALRACEQERLDRAAALHLAMREDVEDAQGCHGSMPMLDSNPERRSSMTPMKGWLVALAVPALAATAIVPNAGAG
jgi:hypothetical protein